VRTGADVAHRGAPMPSTYVFRELQRVPIDGPIVEASNARIDDLGERHSVFSVAPPARRARSDFLRPSPRLRSANQQSASGKADGARVPAAPDDRAPPRA